MPDKILARIAKHAQNFEREIITKQELVGYLFYALPWSPETSVTQACSLLPPIVYPILREKIDAIRADDHVYIPFLIGDRRTPEERRQEALSLVPELKRICDDAEEWLNSTS